eukprot:6474973-Amphidinium_carterae.1
MLGTFVEHDLGKYLNTTTTLPERRAMGKGLPTRRAALPAAGCISLQLSPPSVLLLQTCVTNLGPQKHPPIPLEP